MRKALILIAAAAALFSCSTRKEPAMSERMVRSEMARCTDASRLDFNEGKYKWNYTTGLELKSFLDVYDTYGGEDIFNYVRAWYDTLVQPDGSIRTYSVDKYSTDHICPGVSLFYLYDKTGDEKFRMAMDTLKKQIDGQPRTEAGAFWHKKAYPHQVWLDGVYMSCPFYATYASRYLEGEEKAAAYAEIVNEFKAAAEHTYDPATGLYRHAWDESRSMFWCDPATGQSAHCWGRALGWYCMALVDVLEILPKDVEGREDLEALLQTICRELPEWADHDSGVWYQVLDQPGREGNYLEATCSAMFSYAWLKGIRLGALDASELGYAKELYGNVTRQFISEDEDGLLDLNACCAVAGLGGKTMRKGDYAYYLSEPVRSNDAKGVGPFIWASLEMERLK